MGVNVFEELADALGWAQGKSSPHKRTKQRIRAICAGSVELVMPPDQRISHMDTGSVDPVLWAEFRRVAETVGRDPQDLLDEVVRFSIRRTARHGSQPIEPAKKKGKNF